MLGSGSGQGRLSQESAAIQIAAAAGFFLPFLLISFVLLKFTPLAILLSLTIAAVGGVIVSRLAERIARAKHLLAQEAARKEMREGSGWWTSKNRHFWLLIAGGLNHA